LIPPCINVQKWTTSLCHHVTFLGFEINTCSLTLTWPLKKRQCLQQCITAIKAHVWAGGFVSCKLLAQALGLLHNGCFVLPLGSTFSLQLQYAINDCIKEAFQGQNSLRKQCIFWDSTTARITPGIVRDLDDLSVLLEVDTPHSRAWS